MNKAFTKESDDGFDEVVTEPRDLLPPGVKNYVTPEGAAMLRAELKKLAEVERPRVTEHGSDEAGPVSDSSAAKRKRLQAIDRRIVFLRDRISNMVVVDPGKQSTDKVRFGATVTVVDGEDKTKIYKIVGVDEADPSAGKVSWLSPISRALLGTGEGDLATVELPGGEVELEIIEVSYD